MSRATVTSVARATLFLGMGGLGDSIYQRPIVRAQLDAHPGRVWLQTPWPELYADLEGLRIVRPPKTRLRTQDRNIERTAAETWSPIPARHQRRTFSYSLGAGYPNIIAEMEGRSGITVPREAFRFDLPDFGPPPVDLPMYALLRPVTIRKEWNATSRAPDPAYIARAAQLLRARGIPVVLVADVHGTDEWMLGDLPEHDVAYLKGELSTSQLLALVAHAAVNVGGIGFQIPAAIAAGTPLVTICGGLGGMNAPELLTDPRMDLRRTRWLLPDQYCRCRHRGHDCPKTISDFDARFERLIGEVLA